MREFGSDFHKCDFDYRNNNTFYEMMLDARYYASGRLAIDAIVAQEGWKRIWMPAYFCYEIINHIAAGIEVKLYDDNPLIEDERPAIDAIPFEIGDVLLRMNFFGLRDKRSNEDIPVQVIENHTHGLTCQWSLKSDADYCMASLRKSLPLAAGGVLWSPKRLHLPEPIPTTQECKSMGAKRYKAMRLKADYIKEKSDDKDAFRKLYLETEDEIDALKLSGIDRESKEIVDNFDIRLWSQNRVENWEVACKRLSPKFHILKTPDPYLCYPFSLVILCDTPEERTRLKQYLVNNKIYPAVLWNMPNDSPFTKAKDFSLRMLSIHCDPRYSRNAITQMCDIINKYD